MESNNEEEYGSYKWGIFYYNKKDARLLVPKGPNGGYGLTFNFANKWSYACMLLLLGLIAWIIIGTYQAGSSPSH